MKETRVHLPYVTLIIQKPSQLCVDSDTKGIEFMVEEIIGGPGWEGQAGLNIYGGNSAGRHP